MLGLAYFLKKGLSIYTPGAQPPYVFGIQLPLYLWLIGLGSSSPPSFLTARLISVLASLVTFAASAVWLGKRRGLTGACIGLALLLVHPLFLGWGALARADNLGLCFSVLAILIGRPLPSLGLCLLALLTKQSFLAAPLALAVTLDRRSGSRFLIGYTAAALILFQAMNHGLFQGHLPTSLSLVSDWPAAIYLWKSYFGSVLLLIGLACLAPASMPEVRRLRAYALWSLVSVAAVVKQGTFYNYFLELHWALSMLAALTPTGRRTSALLATHLLIASFTQFPILKSPVDHWRFDTLRWLTGGEPAWIRALRANDQLGAIFEAHPGPVLAEQCGNPLVFGREPIVCDCFALFNVLPAAGAWNPEPLLEQLRRREIAVILLQRVDNSNLRIPPHILQVILNHYDVVGRLQPAGDFVLLPKP